MDKQYSGVFVHPKEFDGYVVDYIIEGLLPIKHVDSPAFIKLMSFISPEHKAFRLFGAHGTETQLETDEEEDDDAVVGTDLEFLLLDYDDADDRYKLPWHCKCVAHLLNLLARKDAEKALETPAFKLASDSALTKL
ncbi:hypothetical protein DAPPUDRAFT_261281 [Daphnia pulex]|uniref:Uncharacterized protein n=1 Tax=Daphnia pulex TaxID=6669 RepID=E9HKU6_DAPPU|nr:hypothetical protein DAPPUDRAFT_261281 [Daphnia pulex]|eukprot:EFX67646.1 hypothetical protein DAPPUDRAFT_261281 [Daphnia pulex]